MPNGELLRRLERVIGTSKENMRRISGMLRAGEIDVNGWERGMRHQLRFQAKYSAALGGNTTDLTFQMYGRVGAELKKQYGYLDNFKSKLVELQKTDPEKFKEMLRVDARSELYAGSARAHYFNTARYAGLLEKVTWVLTTAESCFPAGTRIATSLGSRPIEDIRKGDFVETLVGMRMVTKTFKSDYSGQLIQFESDDFKIECTPNHPFLTGRGWVEARYIRDGDSIFTQDGNQIIKRKIAFPYSCNLKATRNKIGILSLIPFLLSYLPIAKRFETRMAMPIIAVRLNNQIAYSDVNNKLGLDKECWFKTDTKLFKHLPQPKFKLGRLRLLQSLMSLKQFLHDSARNFRVTLSPLLHFVSRFRIFHRVMILHPESGNGKNDSLSGFRSQAQAKPVSFAANLYERSPGNFFCNYPGSFIGVMKAKILNLFLTPKMRRAIGPIFRWQLHQTFTTIIAFSPTIIASTEFASFPGNSWFLRSIMDIATLDTTKALLVVAATGGFAYLLAALFAKIFRVGNHELPPCNDILRLYTNERKSQAVFNLEVDEVHHYIANGFVVHNCDDCVRLAAGGPYVMGMDLNQVPGDGATICRTNCGCYLEPAE